VCLNENEVWCSNDPVKVLFLPSEEFGTKFSMVFLSKQTRSRSALAYFFLHCRIFSNANFVDEGMTAQPTNDSGMHTSPMNHHICVRVALRHVALRWRTDVHVTMTDEQTPFTA
jgi:hypothetical protein